LRCCANRDGASLKDLLVKRFLRLSLLVAAASVSACSDANVPAADAAAPADALHASRTSDEARQHTAYLPFGRGGQLREVAYGVHGEWAVAEGDILLGRVEAVEEESRRLRTAVAQDGRVSAQGFVIKGANRRWPNGEVRFRIDTARMGRAATATEPAIPAATIVQQIRDAIAHWEQRTAIRFIELPNASPPGGTNWISFEEDPAETLTCATNSNACACRSHVGMKGGKQEITLPNTGCGFGPFVHEVGHALGLFHEHTRPNRDEFITLNEAAYAGSDWDNAFGVKDSSDGDTQGAYDFGSIMHYGPTAFAKAGEQTITPKPGKLPAGVTMGQRNGLSDGDIRAIGATYGTWVSRKAAQYNGAFINLLGAPLGDEAFGKDWGTFRHYQYGSVFWHRDTGAHVVTDKTRSGWTPIGYEWSALGYPTSDTLPLDGDRFVNHFQGGRIYGYPQGAVHVVPTGTALEPSWVGNFDTLSPAKSDYATAFDFGSGNMGIWVYRAYYGFWPERWYLSGNGNFELKRCGDRFVSGDFNRDGRTDLACMYDYGNASMGLWTFLSTGSSFRTERWHFASAGGFDANRCTGRFVASDLNRDGTTDLACMYDYGNSAMGVWAFLSNGSSFHSELWNFASEGSFDATRCTGRFLAGDFDGDGASDDVTCMYEYNDAGMGLFTFLSTGTSFVSGSWHQSGAWNFDAARCNGRLNVGDFDGDGKNDDLTCMYDYGNAGMGVWTFLSDGARFVSHSWYASGAGNWEALRCNSRVVVGDFDADGKNDDLACMYDYPGDAAGVFTFLSSGSGFSVQSRYQSGAGNWEARRCNGRFLAGDFLGDGKTDIACGYDYGQRDLGWYAFGSNGADFSPGLMSRRIVSP
jgi:hypothetical protein